MITKEQILAALKKLGPSSPTAIGNTLGAEPSSVGYHLRNMLKDKSVKAAGTSNDRLYALPEQPIEGVKAAPPQERRKRKKAGNRKGATPSRARAATPLYLPAFTAEQGMVIVQDGQAPQIFSPEQTQAIADLLLIHFEI